MKMEAQTIEKLEQINEISSKIAAEALGKMINCEVSVDMAQLCTQAGEELENMREDMIFSICEIKGDVKGEVLLAFLKEKGLPLLDMLMYQNIGTLTEIDNMAEGCFKELTNIVGGAYISSLANHLSSRLLPQPPEFISDKSAFADMIRSKYDICKIMLLKNTLKIESANIDGSIFFVFNCETLNNAMSPK